MNSSKRATAIVLGKKNKPSPRSVSFLIHRFLRRAKIDTWKKRFEAFFCSAVTEDL
jgi:hypothetical protein